MGEGLDFFISYTQADLQRAEWIASVLKEAGYKVHFQAWDMPAGSNFALEMQRASTEAERTVAVLSPDYLNSEYAMAEWAAAFAQDPSGKKRRLLQVRVREVTLSGPMASIVYVDLVDLDEVAARDRLLKEAARGRAPKLESLPLDEIPAPGPLPDGSCMPLSVNPLFVGRDEDLRILARQLKAGETSAIGQVEIAAATGMGGIGKTQLASEFVHRYGGYFTGGVFWLSFSDPAGVAAEIAASGRGLNLDPSFGDLPLDQQVRLVEDAWKRPIPRLLVFDNCEEPELLARWRPNHGGARVLVTSRRSHWDHSLGVKTLALGTLKRADSIRLLHSFRSDLAADETLFNEIADELGDLPLALHLAGSFLARYQDSSLGKPAAYLEQLRKGDLLNHPSLQGRGADFLPTEHDRHVAKTFALSYEKLSPEDPVDALAQALLARAAHFAPGEPIPRGLLMATVGVPVADGSLEAEDAVARLIALGLLERGEEGSLLMHRLVAFFSQGFTKSNAARVAVEDTLIEEATRLNKEGYPAPLLSWQAHLRSVTDAAKIREDERAARLCNELGFHLLLIGNYSGAREFAERALLIREKVWGPEHTDTVRSLNRLGVVLYNQGDSAKAREHFERVLDLRRKVLGPDHPDTAASLNNLGAVLESQDDPSGARSYYEQALEIHERILGPEHRDTAWSLDNLGAVLERQGDLSLARKYFERALALRRRVLGVDHPDTAQSLNGLGGVLERQGNFAEACECYEKALRAREKVLGPGHPDTARSLNSLGGLLYNQGNYSAARDYYEHALTIFEQRLGPEHPHTKSVRSSLALLVDE
ncbi:MAG TPA: FxSxx-COOH system tetratricopeptide repeat protein [Thermoanaerobaculia bacterium]